VNYRVRFNVPPLCYNGGMSKWQTYQSIGHHHCQWNDDTDQCRVVHIPTGVAVKFHGETAHTDAVRWALDNFLEWAHS